MNGRIPQALVALAKAGWSIQETPSPRALPPEFARRYGWLPAEVTEYLASLRQGAAPHDRAWLVTSAEIHGDSDSAFAWNQWELDSLEAAEGDDDWIGSITAFWDDHCPLYISVDGRYAYLAIRRADGRIVGGSEPEYEETEPVADSLPEMLDRLVEPTDAIGKYL